MPVLSPLASTADITTAIGLMNAHPGEVRPELFYDKILLDTIRLAKEHYIHFGLADTKPIQGKAEKLQLRRWSPLAAHTVPLSEGVPPRSDKGTMESWELGTHQYGRYMEFTDKVDWNLIDPVIAHYTGEYSLVAVETLDLLAREALLAVPNMYYAGLATGIGSLTLDSAFKPSLNDLRIIINGMKKRLVKPRKANKYLVIGTPDFFFDMVYDTIVKDFLTINQSTKDVFSNTMIPDLFEMTFTETMAYSDSSEFTTINGGASTKALRVYRRNAADTAYEYANVLEKVAGVATGYYVTETDVYLGDKHRFTNAELNAVPVYNHWDLDAYNTDNQGAGNNPWVEFKVNRILVVGKDALVRTNIEGRDNAKMYVKGLGSAGVLDPIDQRQSIGFKIDAVGFGVERLDAVAQYVCVPSLTNA